jgi:hypothetical protein
MTKFTYEIFEDGYDIFKYGKPYITQREPLANLFVPAGNYEDNAKAQIKEIEDSDPEGPSLADKNRADIDFMALMLDIDLPTEEEPQEEEE